MDDLSYRQKLIESGVLPHMLDGQTSHELNCIGNIRDVYRTTMKEQNPARFAILQERSRIPAFQPLDAPVLWPLFVFLLILLIFMYAVKP